MLFQAIWDASKARTPVVRRMDNVINWINRYPLESVKQGMSVDLKLRIKILISSVILREIESSRNLPKTLGLIAFSKIMADVFSLPAQKIFIDPDTTGKFQVALNSRKEIDPGINGPLNR